MTRILWINPVGTNAYDAPIGEELRREASPGTRVDSRGRSSARYRPSPVIEGNH